VKSTKKAKAVATAVPAAVKVAPKKPAKKLSRKDQEIQDRARLAVEQEQAGRAAAVLPLLPAPLPVLAAVNAPIDVPIVAPVAPGAPIVVEDLLTVGENKWIQEDEVGNNIEAGAPNQPRTGATRLVWPPHMPQTPSDRTHLHYWMLAFPWQIMSTIVNATFESFSAAGIADKAPCLKTCKFKCLKQILFNIQQHFFFKKNTHIYIGLNLTVLCPTISSGTR